MKLLPALKPKKRYIAFQIDSEKKFTASEVKLAVEESILRFLGEFGIAKTSPQFLKERCKNNKFVIKVGHKGVDECKAAIILIKKIKNNPVLISSIITSGTLKKVALKL